MDFFDITKIFKSKITIIPQSFFKTVPVGNVYNCFVQV
jgi:hypothetical protein